MSGYELISQFTEDAFTKEDRICERPTCGSRILKGEPCHYMATVDPGNPGRRVCASCYARYEKKLATCARPQTSRTTGLATASNALPTHSTFTGSSQIRQIPVALQRHIPDPCGIQQSVNAAQRKSSVNPPAVVAIHHSQVHRDHGRLMGPPPVPHHTSLPVSSTTGPHVIVPGPWQHTSTGTHHSSNGRGHSAVGRGYTANHVQYGTERERWAKMSYVVPPAETISLEISAVHEGPGRRRAGRGVPFGDIQNICEGKKDVDARIDAPGLIEIALDTVLPKIQSFSEFCWRPQEFVVRDGGWVDLSTHRHSEPYFYSQCVQQSRKGAKTLSFKTKQFTLLVVVPESQWREYEAWLEQVEEDAAHQHIVTSEPGSILDHHAQPSQDRPADPANSHYGDSSMAAPSEPTSMNKTLGPVNPFHSPEREHLKKALRSGGIANFDVRKARSVLISSTQGKQTNQTERQSFVCARD
ncbi:hypothetical protein M405DRAFT_843570 [Rhizopogon salebrosus TDB-379]|nr:hypothetical protein M405DRAFT_843570 [Rhizopogon salebrosus TDB-379]